MTNNKAISNFEEVENEVSKDTRIFKKWHLEKHYKTDFTDNDIDIINREYSKIDFEDLEISEHNFDTLDNVAWFYKDISSYFNDVYDIHDYDTYEIQLLLFKLNQMLIDEPNKEITLKQLLLFKEPDIKSFELSGGKIIHFDTSYNFEWDSRSFL